MGNDFFSKKKEQNENKKKRISTFTSAEAFYAKSAMSTWLATHKTSNENLALLRLTRRLEHNSYRLSPHSLVSCLYVYMTNNGKKGTLKKDKKITSNNIRDTWKLSIYTHRISSETSFASVVDEERSEPFLYCVCMTHLLYTSENCSLCECRSDPMKPKECRSSH